LKLSFHVHGCGYSIGFNRRDKVFRLNTRRWLGCRGVRLDNVFPPGCGLLVLLSDLGTDDLLESATECRRAQTERSTGVVAIGCQTSGGESGIVGHLLDGQRASRFSDCEAW
jgi:hypothetical protein